MRELDVSLITDTVRALCINANCVLPEDMRAAIIAGQNAEQSGMAMSIFKNMIENYEIAEREQVPICQDTGMAVVFVELGQDVHLCGGLLEDAVNEGVRRGYADGYLRKSVVEDPLRRVNTGDNTPAMLHVTLVAGESIRLTVAPKGFGSENMSAVKMFTPSATRDDVIEFIVGAVRNAGSNPCPPVVVGAGIGGTFERAAYMAKHALLRRADQRDSDTYYADMEADTLLRINALNIGPQGLGGCVTALAVHIEHCATHIAGLPVAVNMNCHVNRHASAVL